jgi:hypothetical protein
MQRRPPVGMPYPTWVLGWIANTARDYNVFGRLCLYSTDKPEILLFLFAPSYKSVFFTLTEIAPTRSADGFNIDGTARAEYLNVVYERPYPKQKG